MLQMYNIYINNRSFYFFIKFVVTQLIIQNEDNQVKKQEYGQKRIDYILCVVIVSDTVQCRKLIPYGIGHFSQFALQQPRDPNDLRDMCVRLCGL